MTFQQNYCSFNFINAFNLHTVSDSVNVSNNIFNGRINGNYRNYG